MAASLMKLNMNTLYDDLMYLCSMDDTFYYKDIRLQSIPYRIFNYRLCSYATFQSCPVALNCRGTMFNILNPKNVHLVSLPPEKFFNYNEGFGRKQYHERGRFGDKMEKMDGTLISTFLHRTTSKEETIRLKSKLSLTSQQAIEATQLLTDDFKSEIKRLVRLNYTVNMEYTSPTNHVVVCYTKSQLSVLSIRSHTDGETLLCTRLKTFLYENNFLVILNHLVPFETVPSNLSHRQLLENIYKEPYGEGYVVEIIYSDQSSYLVKIKTQIYLSNHQDSDNANSSKSLFEAVIHEHSDDLRGLFQDDVETLERINKMERYVKPIYNGMIESIEQFYRKNKHLPKNKFIQSISMKQNMKIYLPLLVKLYTGEDNDYKRFAMKHAKDLFRLYDNENQLTTVNNKVLE